MKKRLLSLLLVATMVLSLAACGGEKNPSGDNSGDKPSVENPENKPGEGENEEPEGLEGDLDGDGVLSYDEESTLVYNMVLGDFYELYMESREFSSDSERWAKQALAEAKLLESGVFVPTNTSGGAYALSKVVPKTANYALWGNDSSRLFGILVCTELLKGEDRAALKVMWNDLKGTGTYKAEAIKYLESKGYTLKDSYNMAYTSDPDTWDVFNSDLSVVSEPIVNTFDGLLEYDCEGNLNPALAKDYKVSDDGLTYTFYLREGVKWVDNQGREIAEVTAEDFVAGMQHMMDAAAGLEYLVENLIEGAYAYIYDETDDFGTVGVKAVDKYTVEYTLTAPTSYFPTMVGYSIFAPMCKSFYESLGGKFGAEYDSAAADYLYGKGPDSIAYCGPYLITSHTANNSMVFKANESYYNKEKVTLQTITWLFNDGTDVTKTYNDVKAGTLDGASLNTSTLETAKADGLFDDYHYISDTDASTYNFFFNVNRKAYANYNDESTVVSEKTDEEKERAVAALKNKDFRLAVAFSIDKLSYNAQFYGDDVAAYSLRNSYTPWNFQYMLEDVTVDINGTPTTFKAGTPYGEIVQAQLDADGSTIVAYDPTADNGAGSGDGYDGWFNPEAAAEHLEAAIAALKEQGVEISAENPIKLDLPYMSTSATYTNAANVVKQSIEKTTNGCVVVNLVVCNDVYEWYYSSYFVTVGSETNHDLNNISGWIPDYGDPSSYLDTILPDYAGSTTAILGMF